MLSFEPCKGQAVCSAEEVPSFLSYFKTPSIGPARGIKPMTSHSAVHRSTDRANPAVDVNKQTIIFVYFHPSMVITVFIKLQIISPNINKYKICTLFSVHFFSY